MSKKQKTMKISIFFVLFCTFLYFFVLVPRAFAVSPTVTTAAATPTISEEEVKNSLQERLKKAALEKGAKADQVLGAKAKLAVVGKLSDVSNNTFTIRAGGETNELVTTDNETVFVRNNKTVKREDIQIGDWVIAMGYRGDNGNSVVVAKRVVAREKQTEYPKRTAVKGKVASYKLPVTSGKITFTIGTEGDKMESFTITIPAKSKLAIDNIQEGKTAILIGEPDKTDSAKLTVKAIKIL
jgi:hypothetical protein